MLAAENEEILSIIEKSIFVLCIDGPRSKLELEGSNELTSMTMKMIHGGGSQSNSANRWFDKTVQVRLFFKKVSVSM
jgi:hypothetical protein